MTSSEIAALSLSFSANSGVRTKTNNIARPKGRLREMNCMCSDLFSPSHGAPVNGVEKFRIFAPGFLNLHEEFEENFAGQHFFDFQARRRADFLQICAARADNNRLLPIAFHVN